MKEAREGIDWGGIVKRDLPASLVVFLVALPLCMAIAVASGLPASAGLITGIVGGIVVGSIAGSPLQVSGPAAGLIVLVAGIIANFSSPEVRSALALPDHLDAASMMMVVLFLAGGMQIAAGLLRLAPWFRAVAPSVIQAMLAGIGALILFGQFHVLMDLMPQTSGIANLWAIPGSLYQLFVGKGGNPYAAVVGVVTIAIIALWTAFLKKKSIIPGSLVAVVVASLIAYLAGWQMKFVAVPGNFLEAMRMPSWDAFLYAFHPTTATYVWSAALGVAAIASAESLLCATAVDQLHNGPRTQYDRELLAQGIGNTLCALLGGLPMTGVIVRSSANIDAGGKSRASAIMHGVWILGLVVLFPQILTLVPMAALAGILVYTGFKLISIGAIKNLWAFSRSEVLIYAATFSVIVGKDLLVGVLVGVMLSAVKLLYTFTRLSIRLEEDISAARSVLHLEGAATFIRLPQLAAVLESVPPTYELHVNMEKLDYIDHACLDLFTQWAKQHQSQGGRLVIDWSTLHACFRQENGDSVANAAKAEMRKAS